MENNEYTMDAERLIDTSLIHDIKFNCDVSDAQYWGYFSICGLLMRYRDLYRSEAGLKAWTDIRREDIVEWIKKKESRWPELEGRDLRDVTINGKSYGPFDIVEINRALNGRGLIYGAGYGMYMKPTFFLAELRSKRKIAGAAVFTSKKEYARDLFASTGMLQGNSIFLRLEPLEMLLMEKFLEFNSGRSRSLEDAFLHYGFQHRQRIDAAFKKRLEETAERFSEVLLYHELAEFKEAVPEWKDIISTANDRKTEHFLRAVKDLIADTSDHGPFKRIRETQDRGTLSLSIALREGFLKVLYPEMKEAYLEFLRTGNWAVIEEIRKGGYERFVMLREKVLELYNNNAGEDFVPALNGVLHDAVT